MKTSCVRPGLGCAVLVVTTGLAACVAPQQPPTAVAASNPTVSYSYRGDEQLLQASSKANAYCAQYQTSPHAISNTQAPDGTRTVVFECVKPAMPAPAPVAAAPVMTYTYRTDAELLDASRSAEAYCAARGPRTTSANIVTNGDGSKTVTFRCV
ncbi:MAG: hypothetical protein AB7N54_05445 [Alphaproteobacteria bacterium]